MGYNNYGRPSREYYQVEKEDPLETQAESEDTSQSDSEADIAKREARVKMLRQMAKTTESVDRTSCNHRMQVEHITDGYQAAGKYSLKEAVFLQTNYR